MKRKRSHAENEPETHPTQGSLHFFEDENEINQLQTKLLQWYDSNKRTLPWRTIASEEPDDNIRGYSVWVSEIMLQVGAKITRPI